MLTYNKAPMPRKSLGQHFLRDSAAAARIVRAARIGCDDAVVEIGPGRGALTSLLVRAAGRLALVELDPDLAARLREWYASAPSVTVIEGDARTFDPAQAPEIAGATYKVVANLPYYAASPIIRRLLEASHKPELMVVMVQREVAGEMAAAPGDMGVLSVATQLYARVEPLFDVPPAAFYPPPKVTSTVLRLEVLERPALDLGSTEAFFRLVRGGFSAPRKQLRNSLARGLGLPSAEAGELLGRAGIEASRRPATLSLEEWGSLYRVWCPDLEAPDRPEPSPRLSER